MKQEIKNYDVYQFEPITFVWLHFFFWGGGWYLITNFETPCMLLLLLMMVSRDPRNNYRLVNRVNMIMMVKEKWQPAKKMCDHH